MASEFASIVIAQIGSRSTEVGKAVYNYQDSVKDIERELDRGSIDVAAAMTKLRARFSYHLTDDDYRKIEKETRYNVK